MIENIENEVKENLIQFYRMHKNECNELYSDATNKNKLKIYQTIKDDEWVKYLLLKADIVILTANVFEKNILHLMALREEKCKIVHTIVNSYNNPQRPLNINVYFFDIGDYHILHMEAKQTGSYSMGGSSDLIRFILKNKFCYPSAIISYGICFGNDYHEYRIGDTIIAKKLYPYFMSAKVKEKCFFIEDSNIFNIDTQLDTKLQFLMGNSELSKNNRIFYGNMVTGEAVISNALMKDIFINAATNQPILGGEMEGYGLFKECQGFDCFMPCLLIKSICDWGICKNIDEKDTSIENLKEKLQVYASKQAYKALEILLKKESDIFEYSLYRQIKNMVIELSSKEGEVFHVPILEEMLKGDVNKLKKNNDEKKLCEIILDVLIKDNIIKEVKEGVYSFREREKLYDGRVIS